MLSAGLISVTESWFNLSRDSQTELLEVAAGRSGRPAHLLEKDIWVVWLLSVIYRSSIADKLTFKGGTSLSKVYKIINRFSEDLDLTYDIRELVPDLLYSSNPIPVSIAQGKKITSAIRHRLSEWIKTTVKPIIEHALTANNLPAKVTVEGKESNKLIVSYSAIKHGSGYSKATVQLEFGARATGEPNRFYSVTCDIAAVINGIKFPTAQPLVMMAERTFWEKATAVHVYCLQERLRGERYSRHWYDLDAMSKSVYFNRALNDRDLAQKVAGHKSIFFPEKDLNSNKINYLKAVSGFIQIVPEGDSLIALEHDYTAMLEDGLLALNQPNFPELIASCRTIQDRINQLP
ncbi:MAG: nucleotidyl transferase AbiEii/AbiGii toxin family protein (plasmid) [Candidatus Symbiodolus clandestinus]